MNSLLSTILTNTYTTSDFYRRVDLFGECLENTLFNAYTNDGESTLARMREYAEEEGEANIFSYIEEWGDGALEGITSGNLYDTLSKLKEACEALPTLTLYVPTVLTDEGIAMIGEWCRREIEENIMLEVMIEPRVTGGCAFVLGGEYHDFSFDYFVDKNRTRVEEVMHSYAGRT